MSKKNKELSKLRREVEILKTQLKNRPGGASIFKLREETVSSPTAQNIKMADLLNKAGAQREILENINPYLKRDLFKSVSLAVVSFSLIFLIQALLEKGSVINKFASPLLSRFGF